MDRVHRAVTWAASLLRWAARVSGTAAAFLVLAFFVEHLEWFSGSGGMPPPSVFLGQAFHLLLLTGLVLAWRWEVRGALLALAGAIGFVSAAGGAWRLLPLVAAVSSPALLWLLSGCLHHQLLRHGDATA